MPGVGGVRRPWYYFVTREYWCPKPRIEQENQYEAIEDNKMEEMLTPEDSEVLFEEVGHDFKVQKNSGECLSIEKMTKKFIDGKVAVKDFTLDIYKNQVFILLGHNGAGKTTALSMLNGLLVPTSGKAFIKGIDVFRQKSKLKQMLGICPQDNIAYESLTVEENLSIFCSFKDVNYEFQREELIAKVKNLDFLDCFNKTVSQLSGGQKRKLSILLALLGDASVIMLDEPTSGLDVEARRKIWTVIKETKQDKIILMTTHYMDEAEALGDRIAIMANGEIRCCGSSLFLKKQFKTGYHLTMVKTPEFNQQRAGEFIEKYVHEYQVNQSTVSEIIYNIPFEASAQFPQMFKELDQSLEVIGISSYGIAVTSLEDVFLKVGEDHIGKMEEDEGANQFSISRDSQKSFFKNVIAVVLKVWLQALRNPRIIILEVLLPLILFGFSIFGTSFRVANEYLYEPDAIPKRLPIVINSLMPNPDSAAFETLKRNIPYELLILNNNITANTPLERAKEVYNNEIVVFGNVTRFGAYYIENITKGNFTAMVIGDPNLTLMPSYLCSLLTNAYLKTYKPETTVTQRVIPMTVYNKEINFEYIMNMIIFVILTGIAASVPVSSIAYFLVQERRVGQKLLEMFHGLNMHEYWIGRFIADLVKLLIPFSMIIIIKLIFGIHVIFFITLSYLIMNL